MNPIRRDQVRVRYKPSDETYHLFLGDKESKAIDIKVIDNPSALDKAKDHFFASVLGRSMHSDVEVKEGKTVEIKFVAGVPVDELTRQVLSDSSKKTIIEICVREGIEWTDADTKDHMIDRIAAHFKLDDQPKKDLEEQ